MDDAPTATTHAEFVACVCCFLQEEEEEEDEEEEEEDEEDEDEDDDESPRKKKAGKAAASSKGKKGKKGAASKGKKKRAAKPKAPPKAIHELCRRGRWKPYVITGTTVDQLLHLSTEHTGAPLHAASGGRHSVHISSSQGSSSSKWTENREKVGDALFHHIALQEWTLQNLLEVMHGWAERYLHTHACHCRRARDADRFCTPITHLLHLSFCFYSQWSTQRKSRLLEAHRSARDAAREARSSVCGTRANDGEGGREEEEEKNGVPAPRLRQKDTQLGEHGW